MILPECLYPAMSRGGFAPYENGVSLGASKPGDFPQTTRGQWLSTIEVSMASLDTARRHMGQFCMALGDKTHPSSVRARDSLANAEFDTRTGCWRANSTNVTEDLWTIATHEMGRVLNDPDSKQTLQTCDSPDCLNTRHFDLTFGIERRQALYEPAKEFYSTLPDGRVATLWGDSLPSVADSVAKFLDFRLNCPPFIKQSDSILTANGISQITVDETTGCWKVRSHYSAPNGNDNYGRLTLRRHLNLSDHTSAQMLAHRVIWLLTGHRLIAGKELNHLCGYRACCNPDHLRQVTKSTNNRHSLRMQRAISALALPSGVVV